MTELTPTAVQTIIQSVSGFSNSSVVVNDWSFLDGTREDEPWVRIESGGLVDATFEMSGDKRTWMIPVTIIKPFYGEWDVTRAALCDLRIDILDTVSGNNAALPSIGDSNYRSVERISDVNPNETVQPVLTEAFLEALQIGDAIPDYLQLQMIWEIYEEIC